MDSNEPMHTQRMFDPSGAVDISKAFDASVRRIVAEELTKLKQDIRREVIHDITQALRMNATSLPDNLRGL